MCLSICDLFVYFNSCVCYLSRCLVFHLDLTYCYLFGFFFTFSRETDWHWKKTTSFSKKNQGIVFIKICSLRFLIFDRPKNIPFVASSCSTYQMQVAVWHTSSGELLHDILVLVSCCTTYQSLWFAVRRTNCHKFLYDIPVSAELLHEIPFAMICYTTYHSWWFAVRHSSRDELLHDIPVAICCTTYHSRLVTARHTSGVFSEHCVNIMMKCIFKNANGLFLKHFLVYLTPLYNIYVYTL